MITSEVINRAISYIFMHISENITVEEVADHCHFSKFYFERIFKEETGESVYAFIKRVKMEQSAFRLKVERGKSITDIGCEYGYSSSNYSSAFKQHHNMTPAAFRKHIFEKSLESNPNQWKESCDVAKEMPAYEECDRNITIEQIEDMFVLYERRIGNYRNLKDDWCEFMDQYHDYMTETTQLLECTFDDPSITNADGCLYDICMTVDKSCPLENTRVIQGGKFVVYHFAGYAWQIYPIYQSLLNIWFPRSHYEIDNRYGFDKYHYVGNNMYMVVDFCIPIK